VTNRHLRVLAGVASSALVLAFAPRAFADQSVSDAAPGADTAQSAKQNRPDNLPNPLGDSAAALRERAVGDLVTGKASVQGSGKDRVIKVADATGADDEAVRKGTSKDKKKKKDKFVWYPTEREETIFTILTDFGTQTLPATGGAPGPLHNEIPEPDRVWDGNETDNNSTIWKADFDRDHYMDLMFGEGESMRDFYLKQSNGKFLAKGDVSDWVKVPFNEARYGHNPVEGDGTSEADGYWTYVKDTATAWYDAQKAAGKSNAEIAEYLKQFDVVDRYDYDGDGDFNEPDGYIDHFQAIHAGEGEEAGGGAEGEDAIWSHRWYAYTTDIGRTGPPINLAGGVPIGDSGIWIGDYTTEPENGGLGVFAHEFGHDLGLRDYYDTAGGDNGTGFWTLMSGGSWLNWGKEDIGSTPGYMGPHEKLLLGWLDYTVADKSGNYKLGAANKASTKGEQAVIVPLKDKVVTVDYNTPHSGQYEWWSGTGDNHKSSLSRTVDLTGKTSASLSAWTWSEFEEGYDNWWVEASRDGATWTELGTYTGDSATWTQGTWDLSAFAGAPVQIRFRTANDGGLNHSGLFIDDIAVTADGAQVFSDNVESGDNGWIATAFARITGSTTESHSNYYIAENRIYDGYDATLKTGPYNFGWGNTKPDWVERFPYQNGMLVWYVDNSYVDNNTKTHPGAGFALPVDARPTPVRFSGGALLGNRRQPFDATFGQEKTDAVTFHRLGEAVTVPKRAAISTFDDSNPTKYWSADNPMNSVKTAGSGTKITVTKSNGKDGERMELRISLPRTS
jgi:immune inhibitor A